MNNETITLKKSDLAKFMAITNQTINSLISDMTSQEFAKRAKEVYEIHMEGDYMETIIAGVGGEFEDAIKAMEEDNG